jgi:hypothetical protein
MNATAAPTCQLYVSADLRWFESIADDRLANDITQGDDDGPRAYRRVDGRWWAWLHQSATDHPTVVELRTKVVALFGADRVAQAEAFRLPWRYAPPSLFRHGSQETHRL